MKVKYPSLRVHPDPILREKASDYRFGPCPERDLRRVLDDLWRWCRVVGAEGLAATQLGWTVRAAVIREDFGNCLDLINPEIVELHGRAADIERSASLPGIGVRVERPTALRARYWDRFGQERMFTTEGRRARSFQQAVDHLDGVTLLDRAHPEDLLRIKDLVSDLEAHQVKVHPELRRKASILPSARVQIPSQPGSSSLLWLRAPDGTSGSRGTLA